MKLLASAAMAAGLLVAGSASASVIFYEGFDEYDNSGVAYNAHASGVNTAAAGSIEAGNSFTTNYGFRSGATNTGTNSMYDEGTWTIGTDPYSVHNLWVHDTGNTNPFLMLNGATNDTNPPPAAYVSNMIAVSPGTFSFSYSLLNLCCNSDGPVGTPSLLQLWYYAPDGHGGVTSTPVNINTTLQSTPPTAEGWQQVSGTFTIGQPGGFIQLGLSDTTTIASGNDFGVDNITLSDAPEPASWALMLAGFGGLGVMLRRRRAVATAA